MTTDKESPTEQRTDKQPIRYALFVCNHNAGRSQMAQAFFERYGLEDVRVVLVGFDGARVRSHILTLAYRQARKCLSHDTCELLEPMVS